MEKQSVVCFGEALWDETPRGRLPGGAPMNVALRLASLDVDTVLLTRVGDDDDGRALTNVIARGGLDPSHVQVDPDLPTGSVLADTTDPGDVRYRIAGPVAWDRIDADAFLATQPFIDTLVFGSLGVRSAISRESLMRLLAVAERKVFDVNLRPPHDERDAVEALLQEANWVKLNAEELTQIAAWSGCNDELESALPALVATYDLELACVTCGGDGAAMYRDNRLIRQPAYPVRVVDTIGCGDAFLATWLGGMLRGADPAATLNRAVAVGALVAAQAGGGVPVSEADVATLLADRS